MHREKRAYSLHEIKAWTLIPTLAEQEQAVPQRSAFARRANALTVSQQLFPAFVSPINDVSISFSFTFFSSRSSLLLVSTATAERRQNRNLTRATVHAPLAELANSSRFHERLVGSPSSWT
jgi:hypothetical protein